MKICLLGLDNLPVLAADYRHGAIGGESVQQTLLARALVRSGHEVSMVVADYGQADGASWDGIRTFKAYGFDAGLPVLRFFHPRWTSLWAALKRADSQVYYTSCAGMEVGLLAWFCRQFRRRFVFRTASDSDCDRARLLVRYARDRWLYAQGLRRADAILVQSELQARLLQQTYGLESRVAGMFVERPPRLRADRDIDVLWVGNMRRLKRPDRLLALARSLPELRFHMIGGRLAAEPELFREIAREAADIGNVVLHGRLPYADANAVYDRARLLVNTSDIEGFPNCYLQAWARGVPVVTLLDPDGLIAREGLGIAVTSPVGLREAVRRLLGDRAAGAAAGARCLAFMERHFADAETLAGYLAAFDATGGETADGARGAPAPAKVQHA